MAAPIHLDPHMLTSLPGHSAEQPAPKVGDLVEFTCTWGEGFSEAGQVTKVTSRGWIYVEVADGAVYRLPAKGFTRFVGPPSMHVLADGPVSPETRAALVQAGRAAADHLRGGLNHG